MIEFANKPDWIWATGGAVAIALLLVWSYRSASGQTTPGRRWLVLGLRLLVLTVVAVCLLDPQRVEELHHRQPARVALLLDTSRSMGTMEGGQSRIETARRWIRNSLHLPSGVALQPFGFARKLEELRSMNDARPHGDRTDLAEALRGLARVKGTDALAGVILVSDGADNVSSNAPEVADELGRDRIPIDTLCVGTTNQPPDIRIDSVTTRAVYTRQATIHVSATLESPGFGGSRVELRVLQGNNLVARETVTLNGGAQRIDLEFPPQRDGFQTFLLEIPPDSRESRKDNNEHEFGLTVSNPKLRVIYMEATGNENGHPEILDLKWALEDQGFEVRALYHEQFKPTPPGLRDAPAFVDPRNGEKIYRVENSRVGFPKTLDELLRFDVVICSDIERAMFSQEQLRNVVRFVEEFGGGFVMVGGVTAFGAGHWNETPWEKIIPVEMALEHDTTFDLFKPLIPPGSENHPLLKLSDDPAENRQIWTDRFPLLGGFNRVDRAKPGAVTLLVHPHLTTKYGPCVILAAQEIGNGRSMALTTDTTAVWGYEFEKYWGEPDPNGKPSPGLPGSFPPRDSASDNRYYRRFWANAMRWLAANKFAREQRGLQIALERDEALPGDSIPVSARLFDEKGNAVRDAKIDVSLLQNEKVLQAVPAFWNQAKAAYCADVSPPASGRFIVRAVARPKNNRQAEARQLLVCENRDVETGDPCSRPALLAEIARNSGGRVLSLNGAVTKAFGASAADRFHTTEYKREPLWDTWVWLAAILGLLTVEWVVRRQGGLA